MRGQPGQDQRLQEPQWNTNEAQPQAQMYPASMQREVDQEILLEKEQEVQELRETIDVSSIQKTGSLWLTFEYLFRLICVFLFLFCLLSCAILTFVSITTTSSLHLFNI